MKKKLFLTGVVLMSAIALSGCANSQQSQALTGLNNQITRVENIVSSTSTSEVSPVSYQSFNALKESQKASILNDSKINSYENMMQEESLRQDVLSLCGIIKGGKNKKYKMTSSEVKSLNSLNDNLSKYTSYLNNTKSFVENNVKKIKKYSSINSIDATLAQSSYLSLNNLMQERAMYLNNLYNTMLNVLDILDNSEIKSSESTKTNSNEQTDINSYSQNKASKPKNYNYYKNSNNQNIDNQKNKTIKYDLENENKEINHNFDEKEKFNHHKHWNKNIDSYINQNNGAQTLEENQNNPNNNSMVNPIARYPFNNNSNGAYSQGIYNGYNGTRNWLFNSGRNTDTFYPQLRNIDTYRFNPSFYNNLYNSQVLNNGNCGYNEMNGMGVNTGANAVSTNLNTNSKNENKTISKNNCNENSIENCEIKNEEKSLDMDNLKTSEINEENNTAEENNTINDKQFKPLKLKKNYDSMTIINNKNVLRKESEEFERIKNTV